MTRFSYKALSASGDVLTGEVAADSRDAAIAKLRARRVVPLEVDARKGGKSSAQARTEIFRRRTVTDKDLMLFTRELEILLGAGIALDSVLEKLDGLVTEGPMRGIAGEVLRAVKSGRSLGDALETRSDVFPAFYVGMVRAGEAGGALAPVLERLGAMLEKSEALKARIRSALTYPTLVLMLTGLSLVVLLVYVVPEFRPMFKDAGMTLPWSTRIVVALSDIASDWGWLIGAGLICALILLRGYRRSAAGRRALDGLALNAPLVAELTRRIETARFCRSLGTLRANGVTLIEAVEIAAGTVSNSAFAEAARQIAAPLARGQGLARPMRATGKFPELALQLIEVGEESGRLHEMMLQVADIYDREVERTIERMLALLSPLVTIVLGCLIAFIIGSILSAILGSYDIAL